MSDMPAAVFIAEANASERIRISVSSNIEVNNLNYKLRVISANVSIDRFYKDILKYIHQNMTIGSMD